ncbi:hypothetical protein C8F04DRAFT_1141810 [Mycena alexandri]|uniref:Uncharacterized protein n=1 Tax=Mycena alexandri TaxID=1745969 RepID=A0AAD6S5F6_9AGAR|nr:hypothetical protein C8F04DRAFT_1141810 [Mycena alexandri]
MSPSSRRQHLHSLRSLCRLPVLLHIHSPKKVLGIVRKFVDRTLDRRLPREGREEGIVGFPASSETLQVVRGGVQIIVFAGGLERDTGIGDVGHKRERADGAGDFCNTLDEEFHHAEIVPHWIDVDKVATVPIFPVARKDVEVEIGTIRLGKTLAFAASLLLIRRLVRCASLRHRRYGGQRAGANSGPKVKCEQVNSRVRVKQHLE